VDCVYESPCWDLRRNCFWYVSIYAGELWSVNLNSHEKLLVKTFDDIVTSVNICESGNLLITTRSEIISYCPGSGSSKLLFTFHFPSINYRINDCKVGPSGELFFSSFEDVRPRAKHGSMGFFSIENGATFLLKSFFMTPNGIAISEKDSILWVADTGLSLIYQFDYLKLPLNLEDEINPIRVISVPKHLGRPDGANLDINHHYWSANLGFGKISCWGLNGDLLASIKVEGDNPTMIAFAGPNQGILGITYKMDESHQNTMDFSLDKTSIRGLATYLFKDQQHG